MNTTLHEHLQNQQVERLVVGGIQTADCVDTTCRRAFSLSYKVILLKDGHTTFDTVDLKAERIIAITARLLKTGLVKCWKLNPLLFKRHHYLHKLDYV